MVVRLRTGAMLCRIFLDSLMIWSDLALEIEHQGV